MQKNVWGGGGGGWGQTINRDFTLNNNQLHTIFLNYLFLSLLINYNSVFDRRTINKT